MAHLLRVALAFCLLLAGLSAHAVITPQSQWAVSYGGLTCVASDPVAAAQDCFSRAWPGRTITNCRITTGGTSGSYAGGYCHQGQYDDAWGATKGAASCPIGSVLQGSSCMCLSPLVEIGGECKIPACPVGQHEEGGACVPNACLPEQTRVNGLCVDPPPCPAGQSRVNGKCEPFKCPPKGTVSDQWYELSSNAAAATCLFNSDDKTYCTMTIAPASIASSGGVVSYIGGYGVYTGGTCGPSDPGKPTPVDPDKPEGDPGDGTKPPGPKDPKPGEKPNGTPGPGTGPATPTPPNPDGTCPPGMYRSNGQCYQKDPPPKPPDDDGKCPAGYVKVNDKCIPLMPPEDKGDDDKDDEPEGKFNGACGGGFSCEGDAIQCAIAKEQHVRACKLFDDVNAETQLYDQEKVKTGKRTEDLPGNSTHEFSSGMYDSSNMLQGGSCIADVAVEIGMSSVTLPFSRVCPLLAHLRLALLAFGAVAWVFIVFRG